jgi:hypothetical protein
VLDQDKDRNLSWLVVDHLKDIVLVAVVLDIEHIEAQEDKVD